MTNGQTGLRVAGAWLAAASLLLVLTLAAELVDEHRLWVFPVVLGEGKRLFENGIPARALSLVATRSTPSGVLVNTCLPAGPPARIGGTST